MRGKKELLEKINDYEIIAMTPYRNGNLVIFLSNTNVDNISIHIKDSITCCEKRYFVMEELSFSIIGHKILDLEILPAKIVTEESGFTHEINFLKIDTTNGSFRINAHNESNGYYTGFNLIIEVRENFDIEQ